MYFHIERERDIEVLRDCLALPEIFSLLSRIHDFLPSQSLFELCGRSADFAIYILVVLRFYNSQCLTHNVLVQVMNNSRNCSQSASR